MTKVISGRTGVLGILGDPLVQARTPALMNSVLNRRGVDAVLVPMHVPADRLAQAVHGLNSMRNFRGAIVTMPHKQTIFPLLDAATPDARDVDAVNVVRHEPDGTLIGDMLDGRGFLAGLAAIGHTVLGKRVLLIGAGGAASAIAFAVAQAGARKVLVRNRTRARADELVVRMRGAGLSAETTELPTNYDILVNATSAGMDPGDPLPVPVRSISSGTVVCDIILSHQVTPFLAAARERGCEIQNGEQMLAGQIELMADFLLAEERMNADNPQNCDGA